MECKIFRFLIVIVCYFFFTGCARQSMPVAYYTLSPFPHLFEKNQTQSPKENIKRSIGIGPVTLPQILDRPQIVTRTSPNTIHISEFNRWGGSLEDDFLKVLTENLGLVMPEVFIQSFPSKHGILPDLRIILSIAQFDGKLGDIVFLRGSYTIKNHKKGHILKNQTIFIKEKIAGNTYLALVAAKSLAMAKLSQEIAETIEEINE